jgi:hypothetical protein
LKPCDACEVIEFEKKYNTEKVHLLFLKNILRVRTTTPNYLVYGELGPFPLILDIKCRMLTLAPKLSEVNVKDTFTSHIDKQIFLTFLLTPYLYTFSLYENPISTFILGALKSDSTHHFFRNDCIKSESSRFSQFSGC